MAKGLKLKQTFAHLPQDRWPKHTVVDPATNVLIKGPNHGKQLPWILIEDTYGILTYHPASFSFFISPSMSPRLYCCGAVSSTAAEGTFSPLSFTVLMLLPLLVPSRLSTTICTLDALATA
jgi:hypothetical protein